jgi:CRISPR-associated endonuclease/helicase Cas3
MFMLGGWEGVWMDKNFYAQSTDSPDKADWQLLDEHLEGVAQLAEKFAAIFEAGYWGRFAGLLHDVNRH